MAEYLSYGDVLGRERLIDILPLENPLSMIVDPCNVCNFRCIFCPTADTELIRKVRRPKGKMSYELFKKIIDDINYWLPKTRKIKRLYLDKDGEPLLNTYFFEMIHYAKKSDSFFIS